MIPRAVLFAAAAFSALAGAASAQTEVGEVVVTGAPYAVSLDSATTSVEILRREALDERPPGGLGDMLSGLAGVRSTFFGPGASRPVIRGLSGPRVLVLSNGLGQVDASSLSPDHAVATDPQEAERIEVLRGPSALAYGGSAIGGVVNILDGRIPDRRVETPGGRLLISRSSVDDGALISGNFRAGVGALAVTVDAMRRESDDYKVPTFPESRRQLAAEGEPWPGHVASRVENSSTQMESYGAGASLVGEQGHFGLSVKHTQSLYGVPGHGHDEDAAGGAADGVSIDLEQTRYDLRGERRMELGPFDTVRLAAGYADYTHAEIEGGAVGTRFLSEGMEGRLELIQPARGGWQGAVGLQGLSRDFEAEGDEAFVPPNTTREGGLFTLQRFDGDHWGVEGGLRLERHTLASAGPDRGFTGFSGSVGGFVRPRDGWFFSLSGSRSERAPAQDELLAEGPHPATRAYERGDPGLDSEVSWSLDFTTHYVAGVIDVDAHAFMVRYEGFIDLRPTGLNDAESGLPIHRYVQTDAAFHGLELEGSARVWVAGDRSLTLETSGDYVRGETDLGPPARIPPWSAAVRAVFEAGWLTGTAEVRRVGGQDRVADFELGTDGHTEVNLGLVLRPLKDKGFKAFVDVRNLTDTEAREHASFLKDIAPLPGRNLRVGVGYRF